ncbi:MAG TPA: 50S ribosomal protein L18 [Cyanobacteria bacterium UBA8530]|nr:50S ribosomal protein L18 [Cyanobacteria bacterium UBA8530]
MKKVRKTETARRHERARKKISGTPEQPRLAVFRSSKHIYAQIIDDVAGATLVAASSLDPKIREELKSGANVPAASAVGKALAEKAVEKGITTVTYDRGGNLYHGRVAALADAAREAGLTF